MRERTDDPAVRCTGTSSPPMKRRASMAGLPAWPNRRPSSAKSLDRVHNASLLSANEKGGPFPDRPFSFRAVRLRDLQQTSRTTTTAHRETDRAEAQEHHAPGARLRN